MNWYAMKGAAVVEKTPEPTKQLSKMNAAGQFLACYKKKAQPDFKGTLIGGRSVVFEAKHTEAEKIELGALTEEQAERLEKHHNLGAAAFVLVSLSMRDFYRVPWDVWRTMQERYGHKHMKRDQLEPYRVEYDGGVLKLLEGVRLSYHEKEEET